MKEVVKLNLKCHFDNEGWLVGPIRITHLFTPSHGSGFGTGRGVVMHTEDGFEAGTVATFMNRANSVSAFFSIARDGSCHQYVPVGRGFSAWSQEAGNDSFRGVEDEDQTHPSIPLTDAQLTTFAQITEACSEFDGFPLQITDSVNGQGVILHSDGGTAWGGHTSCPGAVRAAQRGEVLKRAKAIRAGGTPAPVLTWTTEGMSSLDVLASGQLKEKVSTVLRVTVENSPGKVYAGNLAAYVNSVFAADSSVCPKGVVWFYQAASGNQTWTTAGMLPLGRLAAQLGNPASSMLQLTCERSPAGRFTPDASDYINSVFARSTVKVPKGVTLRY